MLLVLADVELAGDGGGDEGGAVFAEEGDGRGEYRGFFECGVVLVVDARGNLRLLFDAGSGEDGLHFDGFLPGLRTVGLIHDDGIAAVRKLADVAGDEGELLQDGDDDGNAGFEGERKLLGVLVDLLDHALFVLELVDEGLKVTCRQDYPAQSSATERCASSPNRGSA